MRTPKFPNSRLAHGLIVEGAHGHMGACFGTTADPETINAMLLVSSAISLHLLRCVHRTGNASCAEKVSKLHTLAEDSLCTAFKSAGCCLGELYNMPSAVYDPTFEAEIDRCKVRDLVQDRCVEPTSAPTILPSMAPSFLNAMRRFSVDCPHPTIDFASEASCWALWRVFPLGPSNLRLVSEQHIGRPSLGTCPSGVGTVSAQTLSGAFQPDAQVVSVPLSTASAALPTTAQPISFNFSLTCDLGLLTLEMKPPGLPSSARCQLLYRVDMGVLLGCGPPVPCSDHDHAAWFEFGASSCDDLVGNETDAFARCTEPAVRAICPVSCGRTLCELKNHDAACVHPYSFSTSFHHARALRATLLLQVRVALQGELFRAWRAR
jgi:hypothetical protein